MVSLPVLLKYYIFETLIKKQHVILFSIIIYNFKCDLLSLQKSGLVLFVADFVCLCVCVFVCLCVCVSVCLFLLKIPLRGTTFFSTLRQRDNPSRVKLQPTSER